MRSGNRPNPSPLPLPLDEPAAGQRSSHNAEDGVPTQGGAATMAVAVVPQLGRNPQQHQQHQPSSVTGSRALDSPSAMSIRTEPAGRGGADASTTERSHGLLVRLLRQMQQEKGALEERLQVKQAQLRASQDEARAAQEELRRFKTHAVEQAAHDKLMGKLVSPRRVNHFSPTVRKSRTTETSSR